LQNIVRNVLEVKIMNHLICAIVCAIRLSLNYMHIMFPFSKIQIEKIFQSNR